MDDHPPGTVSVRRRGEPYDDAASVQCCGWCSVVETRVMISGSACAAGYQILNQAPQTAVRPHASSDIHCKAIFAGEPLADESEVRDRGSGAIAATSRAGDFVLARRLERQRVAQ